jgi:hypothetical protein
MSHDDAHKPFLCPWAYDDAQVVEASRGEEFLLNLSRGEELPKSISAVDDKGYWKTAYIAAVPACHVAEVSTLQDPSVFCHVGMLHRNVLETITPAYFKLLIVVIFESYIGR